MSLCPLCEQPVTPGAPECAFCGRVFFVAQVPDAPAASMPDFDGGRMDSRALAITEELTPDLEYSSQGAVGEVRLELVPDVERTHFMGVGEVALDDTPDVERTPLAAKEWTPEAEGPLLCAVCQTPAPPEGVMCESCGYKLPVRAVQEGTLLLLDLSDIAAPESDSVVKCPDCGCKTPPGRLCQACGVLMRPTSA